MDLTKWLRLVGIIVLAAGLLVASLIYRAQPSEDDNDTFSKRDIYQMEKLGGKEYVIFSELSWWTTSLWHGRRLAYTTLALSGAACLGCFWLAEKKSDNRRSRKFR